jgi:hypothetical protein
MGTFESGIAGYTLENAEARKPLLRAESQMLSE